MLDNLNTLGEWSTQKRFSISYTTIIIVIIGA